MMPVDVALRDLAPEDRRLVLRALAASANAYAPYSGFAVGAAVRTQSNEIYEGANLENASYGVTMCAEMTALGRANAAGDFNVRAIAVVGHKFDPSHDASQVVTPCGRCRQLIAEADQLVDWDVVVFSCNGDLDRIAVRKITELLPEAFGPANLGPTAAWPQLREKLRSRTDRLLGKHRPR
jgi:cytidine deaminase